MKIPSHIEHISLMLLSSATFLIASSNVSIVQEASGKKSQEFRTMSWPKKFPSTTQQSPWWKMPENASSAMQEGEFYPHGLPKHTSEEEKSFSRFALKVSLNFTPSNNSKSAACRQVQPNWSGAPRLPLLSHEHVAAFPTKLSSQQLSSIHWETAKTENDDKRNLVYDCDWFRVYHMTAHWILGHASMSKLSALRRPSNRQMSLVSDVKTMKNHSLRTPNFPSPTASPHSGRLPALQPASGMPIVLVYLETWPNPTRSSHRPGGESDGNLGEMTGAGVWCHFYIW